MRLEARDLEVLRNYESILCNVSFRVEDGQSLIVRGQNGIGKSTLLKALVGLLPIESGQFTKIDIAQDCHYLGHENAMKSTLSVRENLAFWPTSGKPLIDEVLERLEIARLSDLPFAHLSLGQARRVALARLLLNHRRLWVLDEPMTGLDSASRARFTDIMQDHLEQDGIIIIAGHEDIQLQNAQTLNLGGK